MDTSMPDFGGEHHEPDNASSDRTQIDPMSFVGAEAAITGSFSITQTYFSAQFVALFTWFAFLFYRLSYISHVLPIWWLTGVTVLAGGSVVAHLLCVRWYFKQYPHRSWHRFAFISLSTNLVAGILTGLFVDMEGTHFSYSHWYNYIGLLGLLYCILGNVTIVGFMIWRIEQEELERMIENHRQARE